MQKVAQAQQVDSMTLRHRSEIVQLKFKIYHQTWKLAAHLVHILTLQPDDQA